MLNVHYRSTLTPRVSERQSELLEHRRMADLGRRSRAAASAGRLARLTGWLLRRVPRRRPDPAPAPGVTIWLDPVARVRPGAGPTTASAGPAAASLEPVAAEA